MSQSCCAAVLFTMHHPHGCKLDCTSSPPSSAPYTASLVGVTHRLTCKVREGKSKILSPAVCVPKFFDDGVDGCCLCREDNGASPFRIPRYPPDAASSRGLHLTATPSNGRALTGKRASWSGYRFDAILSMVVRLAFL